MRAVQEGVLAEMRRWCYRFVVTSTLESLDVLADAGYDSDDNHRLARFAMNVRSFITTGARSEERPVGERSRYRWPPAA